jgi:hypothetical protein
MEFVLDLVLRICLVFGAWDLEFFSPVSIMYQWKICFPLLRAVIL